MEPKEQSHKYRLAQNVEVKQKRIVYTDEGKGASICPFNDRNMLAITI